MHDHKFDVTKNILFHSAKFWKIGELNMAKYLLRMIKRSSWPPIPPFLCLNCRPRSNFIPSACVYVQVVGTDLLWCHCLMKSLMRTFLPHLVSRGRKFSYVMQRGFGVAWFGYRAMTHLVKSWLANPNHAAQILSAYVMQRIFFHV